MRVSGVVEGFYGAPWSMAERRTAFERMAAWGLDTYLYCPKDDLHHRAIWRESYEPEEAAAMAGLVRECHAHGIRFVYGIGPGLDIRYCDASDRHALHERAAQMVALGADGLAVLFDDIPDHLDPADHERWGALADAQADVANELVAWLHAERPGAFVGFCPTAYCGRMAAGDLGGPGYLERLGAALHLDVEVFWTGPEIVSGVITVEHVRDVAGRLRRKPILWDNLHANDYDGRRMMLGPYAGRALALRDEVRGVLVNPNSEFPLDYVAMRTLAGYLHAPGHEWDARAAYRAALLEWWPSWDTIGGPVIFDDLVRLADFFYLPHEDGPLAEDLLARARVALTGEAPDWREQAARCRADAASVRDLCGNLSTMKDRALFHALSRRIWDLREELDLLVRAIDARLADAGGACAFTSPFHLPGTYHGGAVARLQAMFEPHADGSFTVTGRDGSRR